MTQKYNLKYTSLFYEDLNKITDYIVYNLNNILAANRLVESVEDEIKKRLECPLAYEKYISKYKRKNIYYRIYVKNFIIFYIVKDNIMEVRRIQYNKRNLRYFVRDRNEKYILNLKQDKIIN